MTSIIKVDEIQTTSGSGFMVGGGQYYSDTV